MNTDNPPFGVESFAAGEIIFRQGDIPDKFYIITNGRVNIIYRSSNGRDVLINKLGAGDYFGEIGMSRNTLRAATVQAETAVSVMAMSQETFTSWLNQSNLNREEIDDLIEKRTTNVAPLTAYEPEPKQPVTPTMNTQELKKRFTRPQDESVLQSYDADKIIVTQGDTAEYFYILVEGEVEILENDGTQVAVLKAGDYFGEMGVMENKLRSATIRTRTPVQVIIFDRNMFKTWMEKSPFSQTSILTTIEERNKNRM
jgi:CRP-like cAMP-binding protein